MGMEKLHDDHHNLCPLPYINPLNAELNLMCHMLSLLGAHPILHVSRIRVNTMVIRSMNVRGLARVV